MNYEKAMNIAAGCVMASHLLSKKKFEVIDALRECEGESGVTKQELLKRFEHLHGWGIECEEYCGSCDYLEICDTIEQLLELKIEEENDE